MDAAAADESDNEDDSKSSADDSDTSSSFGKKNDSDAEVEPKTKRAKAAAKPAQTKRKSRAGQGPASELPATTRRRMKSPPDTPDKRLGGHLDSCQKYIDSLTELSVDSVWRNVVRAAEAASFWGKI